MGVDNRDGTAGALYVHASAGARACAPRHAHQRGYRSVRALFIPFLLSAGTSGACLMRAGLLLPISRGHPQAAQRPAGSTHGWGRPATHPVPNGLGRPIWLATPESGAQAQMTVREREKRARQVFVLLGWSVNSYAIICHALTLFPPSPSGCCYQCVPLARVRMCMYSVSPLHDTL